MSNAEKKLREFYNSKGWHKKNSKDKYQDSILWEDNREVAKNYVSKCRLRLAEIIETSFINKICKLSLDVGCGPIQYEEYKKYYQKFKENHFLDISNQALNEARKVAKKNSKFICESAVNFKEKNKYNVIIMNHVLYHIDKDDQKIVINNLINALDKNGELFVTYTNKRSFWNFIFYFPQLIFNIFKSNNRKIYFYTHSVKWWQQFNNNVKIKMFPLRSLSSRESKILIPNNYYGKKFFNLLFNLEKKYPNFFIKFGVYYIVQITKK